MTALPKAFLDTPLAHRAFHDQRAGRPENSLAAIDAAIENGYGIEIDVQLSSDGQAMVFHDYGLERLTGEKGAVRQRSAKELSGIVLTGGNEGIPSLAKVLGRVAGRVPLLIEIKDQDGAMGSDVGPLEQAVAATLAGYSGPVAIMSFNPYSVVEMKRLLPEVPRGLVTSAYTPYDWQLLPAETRDHLREIPDYERSGSSFISHEASDLDRDRVKELKAAGAAVLCWTIRSSEAEQAARLIADNITFENYAAALPGV